MPWQSKSRTFELIVYFYQNYWIWLWQANLNCISPYLAAQQTNNHLSKITHYDSAQSQPIAYKHAKYAHYPYQLTKTLSKTSCHLSKRHCHHHSNSIAHNSSPDSLVYKTREKQYAFSPAFAHFGNRI